MNIRFQSLAISLFCSVVFCVASTVHAQVVTNPVTLDSVTVLPMGTISSSDNIQLDVLLASVSSEIFLTQPTTTQLVGNDFSIDIFAQSDLLATPDQESVLVTLGTLSPGTYNYEVNLSTVLIDQTPIEGSFTVVPEPSSLSLVAMLSVGFGLVRRRQS